MAIRGNRGAMDPGVKHRLVRLLRHRSVNALLRGVLRPICPVLPIDTLRRIPIVATVSVELPSGARLKLESDGRDVIASSLFWRGLAGWEPETVAVFFRLLPGVRRLIDVGASTGLFSMIAALERPNCQVVAFEPSPDTFARLEENLRANRLSNVQAVHAAVGAIDGEVELFVPPGESLPLGASTLASFREPGTAIPVRMARLDSVANDAPDGRVDLIKMDTEGTEPAVLTGAQELLARDEPWILCEVLHGMTETGLHAELRPHGYRYFAVTPEGVREHDRIVGDPRYELRNWLFATERRIHSDVGASVLGTR